MNRTGKDKQRFDVIGLGSCAVDLLGIVPSFPKPDTKNKMIKLIQQGGGPVATALVTLARLGAKVSFVGKLGGRTGCPSFEKAKVFLLSFGSERIKSFLK